MATVQPNQVTKAPEKEVEIEMSKSLPQRDSDLIMAKRVHYVNTGVVYCNKQGKRVYARENADISDMCEEDREAFKAMGVITSKLVEVSA